MFSTFVDTNNTFGKTCLASSYKALCEWWCRCARAFTGRRTAVECAMPHAQAFACSLCVRARARVLLA